MTHPTKPLMMARIWSTTTRPCGPWPSKRALAGAGLGAALLVCQGMAAWMRGWRACTPSPSPARAPSRPALPVELVGVLAQMALACA